MTDRKDTALGVARARFVEGLPRKSAELRGAVALIVATPGGDRPREEMRRRLHALYASAQVFRIDALAEGLKEGIQRLDVARDQRRALTQEDLDTLASLAGRLQALGSGESTSRQSRPPGPASPAEPPPRSAKATLLGAAVVSEPPPAAAPPPLRAMKGTLNGMAPAAGDAFDDATTIPGTVMGQPRGVVVDETATTRLYTPRTAKPSGTFTFGRQHGEPHAHDAQPTPFVGTVVSVLVVDGAEAQAQVRGLLPPEGYEVLSAADPEEALRLARSTAPDVVLADRATIARPGVDFVSRLRNDPLTDFVPVVLLVPTATPLDAVSVRELGADDALSKPLDAALLQRMIARVTGLGGGSAALPEIGELDISQIAERLSEELRDGLVRSAAEGRDVKIPLGEGAELLAAAWSAIARVRAHVTARSGGRVRFRDEPRRGGPALLALSPEEDALAAESATEVSLAGTHVLVVDDDPGIVWFFAGLLREEGAEVMEAGDGREALVKLRHRRVDVVISDILMPHLDGFALCREMARDPSLEGVPVILLSWKEDLLTRMRELQSGASGYLRKEAGAPQILARVREVLRPRARLEAQLRTGGEVRGSVERVGILTVLRTVARERPDARVTVRDALHLFEADLRGGNLVHLTRTSTDGSFGRGKPALLQLVGVTAGRFTVVTSDAPVRAMFEGALDRVLDEAAARLGALVDSVAGTGLVHAASVDLDEDALATWVSSALGPSRAIAELLAKGDSPRALVAQGSVAPQALEAVLVDLARRGALRGVKGPGGEDRVAEAFRARVEQPGRAIVSEPPPARLDRPVDDLDAPAVEIGRMVRDAATRDGDRTASSSTEELEVSDLERVPSEPPVARSPVPRRDTPRQRDVPTDRPAPPLELAAAPGEARRVVQRPLAPPQPLEDDDGGGLVTWAVVIVALGLVGFFGYRAYEDGTTYKWFGVGRHPAAIEELRPAAPVVRDVHRAPPPPPVAPAGTPPPPAPPAIEAGDDGNALRFGRVVDGIVDAGVAVAPGQGLLLVERGNSAPGVIVTVDGHDAGAPPVGIALLAGPHQVTFHHGADAQYRFVNVHAGKTNITSPP